MSISHSISEYVENVRPVPECVYRKLSVFRTWLAVSRSAVLRFNRPVSSRFLKCQLELEARGICAADFTGAFRPVYISFAVRQISSILKFQRF